MSCMQSRKLMDSSAYHMVYKTIKNRLAAKGQRPDASDNPLKNNAGEVMTSHDILRVCQHLMNSNNTAADRNLSVNNWLLSCCGRSGDVRLVFQADLCPPKLIKSLGMHAQTPLCVHIFSYVVQFMLFTACPSTWHLLLSMLCNVISFHMVCCIASFCMIAICCCDLMLFWHYFLVHAVSSHQVL